MPWNLWQSHVSKLWKALLLSSWHFVFACHARLTFSFFLPFSSFLFWHLRHTYWQHRCGSSHVSFWHNFCLWIFQRAPQGLTCTLSFYCRCCCTQLCSLPTAFNLCTWTFLHFASRGSSVESLWSLRQNPTLNFHDGQSVRPREKPHNVIHFHSDVQSRWGGVRYLFDIKL